MDKENKRWKALYELLEVFKEIDEDNKKDSTDH